MTVEMTDGARALTDRRDVNEARSKGLKVSGRAGFRLWTRGWTATPLIALGSPAEELRRASRWRCPACPWLSSSRPQKGPLQLTCLLNQRMELDV